MTVITLVFALLATGGAVLAVRVLRGPSVADRVTALDAVLIIVIAVVAALAASGASGALFVDVALVISLLAFIGTCVAARFVEQRGR